jgi:hypothetical protein
MRLQKLKTGGNLESRREDVMLTTVLICLGILVGILLAIYLIRRL